MDFQPLFERPIHPGIETAARYFCELTGDRELPRRQDFRPTKVRSIIGDIVILDVLSEDNDYRYSICSVNIATLIGTDGTNKRLSELPQNDMSARLKKTYDAVVAARSFLYVRGQYVWPDRAMAIERLLIPMADDNGQLRSIFGVVISACPADMLVVYAGVGLAKLEINEQIIGKTSAQ